MEKKQKGVSRMKDGYLVRVCLGGGEVRSRYVSDKTFKGNKERAYKAACNTLTEMCIMHEVPKVMTRKKTDNDSGVVGVYRVVKGKYIYWQAYWSCGEDKPIIKQFSVTKMGEEKAKQSAIDWRKERERSNDNSIKPKSKLIKRGKVGLRTK